MDEEYWISRDAKLEYDKLQLEPVARVHSLDILENEFSLYAKKFHCAAEKVMDHLLITAANERDNAKLDIWFFAVMYLYTQSLELMLKAILFKKLQGRQERIDKLKEIEHDLEECYNEISQDWSVDLLYPAYDNLNWLERFLSNVSLVDKTSDMFRYPFTKKMERFFPEQSRLNHYAMKQNLNAAYNILSDIFVNNFSGDSTYEHNEPKLLIFGGNYYSQSVIGNKFSRDEYYPFIKSYEEAANFLKNTILEEKCWDELFLPMCYLYRNAVELSLKRIVKDDCKFSGQEILEILNKHSVFILWKKIKDEVEKHANAPVGDQTLINTQNYIDKLHSFDPESIRFRYPININLDVQFRNSTKFSIKNVSRFFNELIVFLDAVHLQLSGVRNCEADQAAEMQRILGDYHE